MKMKKIISMLIITIMLFSFMAYGYETKDILNNDTDVIYFQMDSKVELSHARSSLSSNSKSNPHITLKLIDNMHATAELFMNNEIYTIIAEGSMKTYDVFEKNDYSYGVFEGNLIKNNKIIDNVVFDIHYDTKNKTYSSSSMTIGTLNENNDNIISLEFGHMKKELNIAFFEKYMLPNTKEINKNDVFINNMNNLQSRSTSDCKLQSHDYLKSSSNKEAIAIASYHPDKIKCHALCSMFVKTWLYQDGALELFKDHFDGTFIKNSANTSKVFIKITNEKLWDAESTIPSKIEKKMFLPVFSGSSSGLNMIILKIPTYSIDVIKECYPSNNSNNNQVYFKFWKLAFFGDQLFINTLNPWSINENDNNTDLNKGFCAKSSFSFQGSVDTKEINQVISKVNYRLTATKFDGQYSMQYLTVTKEITSNIDVYPDF